MRSDQKQVSRASRGRTRSSPRAQPTGLPLPAEIASALLSAHSENCPRWRENAGATTKAGLDQGRDQDSVRACSTPGAVTSSPWPLCANRICRDFVMIVA
jgi:hypothetical protein